MTTTGVTAIHKLLDADKEIHGVIGASCSSVCEPTAFITAERRLPQVPPGQKKKTLPNMD